jgi:predicted TIM-barrel fold metal-dependent hydrolase
VNVTVSTTAHTGVPDPLAARQPVIDADAHVVETERTWDYLDSSEAKFRPQIVANADGTKRYWLIDGKIAGLRTAATDDEGVAQRTASAPRNVAVDPAARKMEDIERRLDHMTQLGIDVQVLHNSVWIEQVTDRPDIEVALCRSWNRWLADIWRQSDGRLRWTCVVPTLALDVAASELQFAKDNGAVGVCVRPFDGDLMMLDPYFYPLYAKAEELDLCVAVHIANGDPALVDILRTRFSLLDGFATFRFPTVLACYGLLRSEVPALFPELRWGFIEASAQWVPRVLHELARRNGVTYDAIDNPFRRSNVYVAMQTDDDHDYIVKSVGPDTLVIGTDYGHTDASSEVDAISIFRNGSVDPAAQIRVLSDNPARLYGL